jgi:hypothetical protein
MTVDLPLPDRPTSAMVEPAWREKDKEQETASNKALLQAHECVLSDHACSSKQASWQ